MDSPVVRGGARLGLRGATVTVSESRELLARRIVEYRSMVSPSRVAALSLVEAIDVFAASVREEAVGPAMDLLTSGVAMLEATWGDTDKTCANLEASGEEPGQPWTWLREAKAMIEKARHGR